MPIDADDPDYVAALARGLAVIRCFGPEARDLTLADVAARTGFSRATARRFLLTLESLGYVRLDVRRFSLTARTLDLGYAYLSSLDLRDIALPVLKDVSERLQEVCSLSVFDAPDVVYVAQVPPRHPMYVPISVGRRLPAYATAMGRIFLADLPPDMLDAYFASVEVKRLTSHTVIDRRSLRRLIAAVAKDGYALADQEYVEGARALAVGIKGPDGRTAAALNVSAHASRLGKTDMIRRCLPVLRDAARQLSRTDGRS